MTSNNTHSDASHPQSDASADPTSTRRGTIAAIALGALGVAIFTLGTIGGHNDQPVQPVQVEQQEAGR